MTNYPQGCFYRHQRSWRVTYLHIYLGTCAILSILYSDGITERRHVLNAARAGNRVREGLAFLIVSQGPSRCRRTLAQAKVYSVATEKVVCDDVQFDDIYLQGHVTIKTIMAWFTGSGSSVGFSRSLPTSKQWIDHPWTSIPIPMMPSVTIYIKRGRYGFEPDSAGVS